MSTKVPVVSVVVPVYQGMSLLPGLLDALVEQSFPPEAFEVIVVDNGGNEGIEELVEQYAVCRLAREPQPGSYAARNTGAKQAKGDILAFTDADCVPERDWLQAGVLALTTRSEVDMVGGGIVLRFDAGQPVNLAERYERWTAFPQKRYVQEMHFSATANLLVDKVVFQALQGFNGDLQSGGDRDFGERARAAGHRLVYVRGARVYHPARAKLGELLSKARRVAGGEMARWRAGNTCFTKRAWINMLVPPVVWSMRLLLDPNHGATMTDRLAVILVQHVLYLAVLPVRLGAFIPRLSGWSMSDARERKQ